MNHRAIRLCPEGPELGPDAGFFVFLLFDPPPKKFAIMSDLKVLQIIKKIKSNHTEGSSFRITLIYETIFTIWSISIVIIDIVALLNLPGKFQPTNLLFFIVFDYRDHIL